jgi:hypothetical protein
VAVGDQAVALDCEGEAIALSKRNPESSGHANVVGYFIDGLIKIGQHARVRRLIATELRVHLSSTAVAFEHIPVLRVLSQALSHLGDVAGCVALIYDYWPQAREPHLLLHLVPLASSIVARDAQQRADIVGSLVHQEFLQLFG